MTRAGKSCFRSSSLSDFVRLLPNKICKVDIKATGNNRNCYNIQNDESEERKCDDLSRLPWENADTQTPVHEQEVYISDINEGEMKQKRLSKQLKKRSNRNSS